MKELKEGSYKHIGKPTHNFYMYHLNCNSRRLFYNIDINKFKVGISGKTHEVQSIVFEEMKGGSTMEEFLVEEEHVHDPIDQTKVVAIEVHE
jgi:hypothetical protein